MKKNKVFWNSLCLFYLAAFTACSTLKAHWYIQPDRQFRQNLFCSNPCHAVMQSGPLSSAIGAKSGSYRVLMGPPFIPFWPVEPPILDQSYIVLKWKVNVPQIFNNKVIRIPKKSLAIMAKQGKAVEKRIPVRSVMVRANIPDKNGNRLQYFSDSSDKIPDFIEFKGTSLLEMRFLGLYFSKLKWLKIKPTLFIGEKKIESAVIRFEAKRNYSYTAFELPFAFMPVR